MERRLLELERDSKSLAILSAEFEAACGFPLQSNLVMLARVGSHAHNTWLPKAPGETDDVDYVGAGVRRS